jgi:hypothetical protein
MAAIAHARGFDGTDDVINFTLGTLSGAWNGGTVAVICKPDSTQVAVSTALLHLTNAVALVFDKDANIFYGFEIPDYDSYGNDPVVENEWNILSFTKPTGTAVARFHRYRYSTSTWNHSAGEGIARVQPGSPTAVIVAGEGGADFYKGLIACIGVWKAAELSDGQIDTLTEDIADWEALSPTALWLFNQDLVATDVLDRVGTSHESSITGTTAVAIGDLSFEVGGAALPSPRVRTVYSALRW